MNSRMAYGVLAMNCFFWGGTLPREIGWTALKDMKMDDSDGEHYEERYRYGNVRSYIGDIE